MAVPSRSASWALLILAFIGTVICQGYDNNTTPTSFFYSRPDLQPPAFTVSRFNQSGAVSPGLVFITPYQDIQAGPYIYDKFGNLVWSGYAKIGPWNAHNMHTCQYAGSTHICVFQGNQNMGYARGHGVILNTDYEIVATVQSGGDRTDADQHEFKLARDGQTALITVYQQVPYDLSRGKIDRYQGWVMDSIFQEVNITDGSIIFDWSALARVDPFTTYVNPKSSDVSGDGLGAQTAWDFFHINSVDRSVRTGNYLISGRHVSTVYYINGTDGSIVWRLSAGGNTDFACQGFNFTFQHDAVIRSENDTHMTISLYDNSSNNMNNTATSSTGKIITLDFNAHTAYLSAPLYLYPTQNLLSASQGNTQVLMNGNVFQGYGSWPFMSEHTPDGNAVWLANFAPLQGITMSYRATSSEWHAIPSKTNPTLWTYSRSADSAMILRVSWNGCTEVGSWNFYGGNDPREVFSKIGNTPKGGFETPFTSDTHFAYTIAEAVDLGGKALRNSSIIQTYVPSALLAASCTDTECPQYVPPPPPPPPPIEPP